MQTIVAHVLDVHGCRRVAYIGGPLQNQEALERELAYRRALEQRSIPSGFFNVLLHERAASEMSHEKRTRSGSGLFAIKERIAWIWFLLLLTTRSHLG